MCCLEADDCLRTFNDCLVYIISHEDQRSKKRIRDAVALDGLPSVRSASTDPTRPLAASTCVCNLLAMR